jgi:hypothetical protein
MATIPATCNVLVDFVGQTGNVAMLYALTLSAHDIPVDGSEPTTRLVKSFPRPVATSTVSMPHDRSVVKLGTLQNPFLAGHPHLSGDAKREYYLRLTCSNKVSTATSNTETLTVTMTDVANRAGPIVTSFKLQSTPLGDSSCFDLSTPIIFGDGRKPSISTTDWRVTAQYSGLDQIANNTCTIRDLTLETHDSPIANAHLPSSQQFSLMLASKPLFLPVAPELNFSSKPFSITVWAANLLGYYDVDDEGDIEDSKHTVISMGQQYAMGLETDGTLFATLHPADGELVTATYPDLQLLDFDHWYHIALVWDMHVLRVAVDGTFSPQTMDAAGPLLEVPSMTRTKLGGDDFAGEIKSVAFWDKALSQHELRGIYLLTLGQQAGLLANLEFSTKVLVNAVRVQALQTFRLPSDTMYKISSNVLATGPGGCGCFGSSPLVHFTGTTSYTIEAWIACCQSDVNTVCIVAEKLNSDITKYGYGLQLRGTTVIAQRRDKKVMFDLGANAIDVNNPKWVHVAAVFNASEYSLSFLSLSVLRLSPRESTLRLILLYRRLYWEAHIVP